jgi:hypothetical protein
MGGMSRQTQEKREFGRFFKNQQIRTNPKKSVTQIDTKKFQQQAEIRISKTGQPPETDKRLVLNY